MKLQVIFTKITDCEIIMYKADDSEITKILKDWNDGDENAVELLLPYVYDELKHQAQYLMSSERQNHTLQPTALVHEAFIKVSKQPHIEWKNRKHFFRIVSRLMRQILVDHARRKSSDKRGNNAIHLSLDDVQVPVEDRIDSVLLVDSILKELAELDERQAQIIEMRFFGGLDNAEIAESLEISSRTVLREWKIAKIWLLRELSQR